MNALVEDLDNAISVVLSGKSWLAFQTASALQGVSGIPFYFGDPAKRKILAGNTLEYNPQTFRDIAPTLTFYGLNEQTLEWSFADPTLAQYDSVGEMFGYSDDFISNCRFSNAWLFDWCLEPMLASYAFPSADFGWMRCYRPGIRPQVIMPSEQLHDRAVAEIIIEGWPDSIFHWPKFWGKFGCLRFHNLDRRTLTVLFHEGTSVEIPPLGCKVVRQYGQEAGVRTGFDTRGTYLWRFQSGDAPIYSATRDHNAGVRGCQGFSSLASIPLLHNWLDSFTGFHFDPRVRWDGSSEYAATFGTLEDSDCLAKYALHAGTYRSLRLVDGVYEVSTQAISWQGNTLRAPDLVFEKSGNTLSIKSAHDFTHDVIPLTTNMMPTGAHQIYEAPITVEAASAPAGFSRIDAESAQVAARYFAPDFSPVDVEVAIPTGGTVGRLPPNQNAFDFTISTAKAMAYGGESTPSSSLSTFGERTLTFDGLELLSAWSYTIPLTHVLNTAPGGFLPANLAAWELGTRWTIHATDTLARATEGYSILPGRIDRYVNEGPGYQVGPDWVFTQHPNMSRGDPQDGQDWRWVAPEAVKPGLRYHGQAIGSTPTRTLPVVPASTFWIRAAEGSTSSEWWGEHRLEFLFAGNGLSLEDKRKIWRIGGAREHYNHLAARLNSLTVIQPLQFTDVIYWGAPFGSSNATGNSGAQKPSRFACRLDEDAEALARADEWEIPTRTSADVPAFARLAEMDASDVYGDGVTWLNPALQLIGLPQTNTPPTYLWLSIDDIADLASRLGVAYSVERLAQPMRLGVYVPEGVPPGTDSTWFSTSKFAAYWHTGGNYDFIQPIEPGTISAICQWTVPIIYGDTPSDNLDYIQSSFAQGSGSDGNLSLPFSGIMRRFAVFERVQYSPPAPSGWQSESRSRLLVQPMPHLRFVGQTEDRFGLQFVPIEARVSPPQSSAAVAIDDVVTSGTSTSLTLDALKPILDGAAGQPSESWGDRNMVYVTLIPRSGSFRA